REDKRNEIYEYIRDEVKAGKQAYIVYPLVEESEKVDLQAATKGHQELSREVFPEYTVGLLHGRMKGEEKEKIMQDFKAGDIQILVATTVIEVGIDVPKAAVILIEHAERFGLTQLHQLRGRVGRNKEKSICILLTYGYLTDTALRRIEVMTHTNDGFKIAEEDLQIRGPGELFGTRQHGELNLKIANLMTDQRLLEKAREDAFSLVEQDHQLAQEDHAVIKQTYQKRYKGRYSLIRVG
ncbi:MAG: helicase-related protein, partial [bacterium]